MGIFGSFKFKKRRFPVEESPSFPRMTFEEFTEEFERSERLKRRHTYRWKSVDIERLKSCRAGEAKNLPPLYFLFLEYIDGKSAEKDIASYWTEGYHLDYQSVLEDLLTSGYLILDNQQRYFGALISPENSPSLHDIADNGSKKDWLEQIMRFIPGESLPKKWNVPIFRATKSGKSQIAKTKRNLYHNRMSTLYFILYYVKRRDSEPVIQKILTERQTGDFRAPHSLQEDLEIIYRYHEADLNVDNHMLMFIIGTFLLGRSERSVRIDVAADGYPIRRLKKASISLKIMKRLRLLQDEGYTEYEIMSRSDKGVCSYCQEKNGDIYPLSEAVIGENCPPFCHRCRCNIIGV